MSPETPSITFSRQIAAPPAEVYRAFTNATALREWLCDGAQVVAHEGGQMYLWWNSGFRSNGAYTALEAGKHLAFTWNGADEPAPTSVTVTLEDKEGGTALTLAHAGIGSGGEWARVRGEIQDGWWESLENLQSVLETGDDLRLARRPMLGIIGGEELTAEAAVELGVPVTQGIRLDGTVTGMGAQKAGLGKDDVLVGMAGQETSSWQRLIGALEKHRAGDQVEVLFYRGGEKKTATMELSKRPMADVPAYPPDLAAAISQMLDESNAELEKILAGVSDAQASHYPAEGEWNAKEVIAHLIAGERDTQNWIASLIYGDELNVFANNIDARVKATAAVYQSAPALVEELKRAEAETMAMVGLLPPELAARKGSYVRLGRALLDSFHTRDHLEQIREAIRAAG